MAEELATGRHGHGEAIRWGSGAAIWKAHGRGLDDIRLNFRNFHTLEIAKHWYFLIIVVFELSSPLMISSLRRQHLAASVLAGSGFSRWSRLRAREGVAVLTFHGLRGGDSDGVLDLSLHELESAFRALCAHLAEHYHVVSAAEAVAVARSGEPCPALKPRVLLTFDDGYASNLRRALPILREFDLRALVFVSTAFADGDLLWFQKLDLALARAPGERLTVKIDGKAHDWPLRNLSERRHALQELLGALKRLPWADLQSEVSRLLTLLGVDISRGRPEPLEALTWDELRYLQRDGRIDLGGHTHSHPILARCTEEEARQEILFCAQRLRAELGHPTRWFAYPNGGTQDFDVVKCAGWLEEAGFEAAFSMLNGRVLPGCSRWELPRYGAPATIPEAEATVSGAFETLKQWRCQLTRRAAL